MTEDRDYVVNTHNLAVHELYSKMRPLLEEADAAVVMNITMILLASMGAQSDMEPEQFKAFVIRELDRLMPIAEAQE